MDISVAVAMNGLMTPIVKNTDRKNMIKISREVKELVKSAITRLNLRNIRAEALAFQFGYVFNKIFLCNNGPQSCILSMGNTKKHF